ncbi:MAG: L,D-transpeptidase family protein [Stackebrandtia sp.]
MRKRRAFLTIATVSVALAAATGGLFAYSASGDEPEKQDLAAETEAAEDTPPPEPPSTEVAKPTAEHDCGEVGEYQEEVETTLAAQAEYGTIFIDGKQSKEDCAAIKKFQKDMGISPAEGYAGEVTRDIAKRIAGSDFAGCEAGKGITVCVDLTHQTLWVVKDGERVMEPTVVRTGMAGYATTPGTWKIYDRADTHWSRPYKVWLPYWQNFNAGQGLHETTTYLHDSFGSHGCVNLLPSDAEKLYEMLGNGDTIEVFGKRPGT